MCAILGVSFAPDSRIDRRKLAGALLSAGEERGWDASGYAWVRGDEDGLYKRAVPGSQLSTFRIPRDAEAIILHTRMATHGSPKNDENNHPVVSPSGGIRLVHNGVIWNHADVRKALGEDIARGLPEVDSSVLPAVLETLGTTDTDILEGDAAAAWFDVETGGVVHLARFSHSPVVLAHLEDGSTVFASTEKILATALRKVNLRWFGDYPGPFTSMDEGEYIQLWEGDVIAESTVTWGEDYSPSYDWRSTTSGGGGGWKDEDDKPMVTAGSRSDFAGFEPLFWYEESDGSYAEFVSLSTMTTALRWASSLKNAPYSLVDDDSDTLRWVNHIVDIGEIDLESGEHTSWVHNPEAMQDYGDAIPAYVRDGVDVLRKVRA